MIENEEIKCGNANTELNKENTVKYDNNEIQANETPHKESHSVAVAVTGFSLFATTIK